MGRQRDDEGHPEPPARPDVAPDDPRAAARPGRAGPESFSELARDLERAKAKTVVGQVRMCARSSAGTDGNGSWASINIGALAQNKETGDDPRRNPSRSVGDV